MTWRAARSLVVLHRQLKAGAPRAASATPPDAWGLIGDAVHDPTSDHSPHDFPGWGDDIVTAADFPNAPALGLDAHKVLDDIRRSRDPRAKYGISNGQIFSNHAVTQGGRTYAAWTWRPYVRSDGSRPADGHYTHGHLSVVGDARADGTQPWQTIGGPSAGNEEDDMGASFGPITLDSQGTTSLCIPPVNAGMADPRPAWLNVCNDTFDRDYALRVWTTTGDGTWKALTKDTDGVIPLKSGRRFSQSLPDGTSCVSISRAGESPYLGHLSVCIERA